MTSRSLARGFAAFLALAMTASVLAVGVAPTQAQAQAQPEPEALTWGEWKDVDFRTWSAEGQWDSALHPGERTQQEFVVSADGSEARSAGNPTNFRFNGHLVSPDQYDTVEIRGTLLVDTTFDDDVIGLVFGYQAPLEAEGDDAAIDRDYTAFAWKQSSQSVGGISFTTGQELRDYTGDGAGGFEIIATNYGSASRWNDLQEYAVRGVYTPTEMSIYIDDELVLRAEGDFEPGHIGTLVSSQPDAVWRDFEYRTPVDTTVEVDAGVDQTVPEGSIVQLAPMVTEATMTGTADAQVLPITIRDWSVSNPDYAFNNRISSDDGIVESVLGVDGKPVYASDSTTLTTTGPENFQAWYNDVPGVNFTFEREIELQLDETGPTPVYSFSDSRFLPLTSDEGFGAEGQGGNFNFTTEFHSEFVYTGGELLDFRGDNDLWVFIDGQLVVDLGGTVVRTATIDMDTVAADLGLDVGGVYDFDLFHAERGPSGSGLLFDIPAPPVRSQVERTFELVSSEGPPVQLIGASSDAPSFAALDDGVYTFRLTAIDGDEVVTDDVTITVENVDPVIGVDAAPTAGDGLVMASVNVTDPGIFDTHGGTIDWGDGSTSTVPASVQGAGWATVAGAHVFEAPGSYSITVTVTDDDGGEVSSSTEVLEVTESGVPQPTIAAGVALWADSSANKSIHMAGTSHSVTGPTHTNGELFVDGEGHSFVGPTEYVTKLTVNESASFEPAPAKVSLKDRPIEFAVADYVPGSDAAVLAGDQYFDMSGECGDKWQPNGVLESGLYYVPCEVHLKSGSFADGPITVVSTGRMHVNGKARDLMVPFLDNLLFLTDTNRNQGISITSNDSNYSGYVVANRSDIRVSSRDNTFSCALLAETIQITGNGHSFGSIGCAEGTTTVDGGLSDGVEVAAAPFVVPAMSVEATAPDLVAPGSEYTVSATVTNDGSTLVVPGLLAVANGLGQSVTVDDADLQLEVFDAAADQWNTFALTTAPSITAIGADTGTATYPAGDGLVGSIIDGGGAGVWSVVASVELTPAELVALFDPADGPLRTRLVLDLSEDAGVRQTTRFGQGIDDALTLAASDLISGSTQTLSGNGQPAPVPFGQIATGDSTSVEQVLTARSLSTTRGDDELERQYLSRLQAASGASAPAITTAQGDATVGSVFAVPASTITGLAVPVVRVSASQPAAIEAGGTATWALTLSNTGSSTAENVTIDVEAFGSAVSVPGIPATLAPNTSETIDVSIPVPADQVAPFMVDAVIAWSDAAGSLFGPLDASVRTRTIVPTILDVDKSVALNADATEQLLYSISVVNTGNDPITNVVIDDEVPEGMTLVPDAVGTSTSSTVVSGNAATDDRVTVEVGTLAPGEASLVAFVADASTLPAGQTVVSNQAEVTSTELPLVPSDDPALPGAGDPTVYEFATAPGNGGNDPGDGGIVIIGIGDIDGPAASDFTPAPSSLVSGPSEITATITTTDDATVAEWETKFFPSGTDPVNAEVIASGTGTPTTLGEIDPSLLRNGAYTILFTATDDQGRTRLSESNVIVDGFLKLGRYSTTYLDSQVTVGGIPLQVLRTYDTLDRFESGDFGYGWNLDVGNFRVYTNRALGLGAWTSTGCGPGLIFQDICFTSDPTNTVTVVWPDGNTESFDFTPKGNTFFPIQATVGYTARDRATSTLQPVGNTTVGLNGNDGHFHNGGFGDGAVYNPTQFLLEAKDGSTYLLDVDEGLVQATDRDGNTVTISDDGIVSSLGPEMTFARDAEGRITTLTEPDGDTVTYSYDAAGDLVSVTDQKGAVSTFGYNAEHYLTEIDDPTGAQRTLTYDDDGRLTGITDANGNTTTINVDPDARTEIVTDPDGNLTTVSTFDERGNAVTVDEIYDGASHVTTFTYDADDQVTSRTDPEGNTWAATYDADENLTSFTDAENHTSTFTYDDFGFPLTVTDADNQVTEFSYDASGNITSITDARNGVQMFTYDARGNQVTRTDQIGRVWEWAYNAESRLTSSTDPRGNTTTYTYDDNGQVTSMTAADGGVTAYSYDGVGNLLTMTDPLNRVTTYAYDGRDLLTSVTDPSGATTTYGYDDNGRVINRTDPTNRTWTYTYEFDRLATETAPDTGVTTYAYDGAGRVSQMTDPLGRTTSYVYDGAHRRTQVTSPIGNGGTATTATAYDGNGRVATSTNAENESTAYSYDALGRLEAITDPIGRTSTYGYDPTGNRTSVTNAENETTNWVFDLAGQLTSVTNAEAETTSYTYDAAGNMATMSDPLNRVTTYGYDAVNRRTTTTLPSGDAGSTVFDVAGQVTQSTSPAGFAATYTYDSRGLVESITDELGNTQSSAYDPAGRLVTATDARNNDTTFTYDPNGRLLSETNPLGGTVTFGYDVAGQRTSLTDPNNATRNWTYDDGGRMTSATDAEGRTTTYGYDDVSRRTTMTDARGITITSTFDDAGQMTGQVSPNETRSYTYDNAGRRTAWSDASGSTTVSYDDVGRMTGITNPAGTVSYGYNAAGEQTSMVQPEGTVTTGYDVNGFVDSVSDWRGDTFTMTNDADGRMLTAARSNGVDTNYSYDGAGRLTGVGHVGPTGAIDGFSYMLDPNGNRTAVMSNAGTETYTLDALNRLTAVTYPGALTETFEYDAAGNRTSHTKTDGTTVGFTVDATGQLISDTSGTTYTYDAAGNLTGTSDGESYTYDDYGRHASISAGGVTQTYGYDAQDVRVTVDGQTQLWDRNGGLPTLISTSNGDNYVHTAGVARDGDGWLLADAVGSVRTVVDNTGATTGSQSFTAFGEQLTGSGTFGFAGEQQDPTGLQHLRARQYNPALGRFTTVDPVQPGAPGTTGYNLYAYAGNNPTTWTDPSGRNAFTESAFVQNLAIGSLSGLQVLGLSTAAAFITSLQICLSSLAPSCPPSFDFPDIADVGAPEVAVTTEQVGNPSPAVEPGGITAEEAAVAATTALLTATQVATRAELQSPECGELIYHYASLLEAGGILLTSSIKSTEAFRAPTTTFRAGAYGTVIPPLPLMTQSELAEHIRPGKDVSHFVALCSNKNPRFTGGSFPTDFADFRVADAPAGTFVPVDIEFAGPNLMVP